MSESAITLQADDLLLLSEVYEPPAYCCGNRKPRELKSSAMIDQDMKEEREEDNIPHI